MIKKERNENRKKYFNSNCYHCGEERLGIEDHYIKKIKKRKIKRQKWQLMRIVMMILCNVC